MRPSSRRYLRVAELIFALFAAGFFVAGCSSGSGGDGDGDWPLDSGVDARDEPDGRSEDTGDRTRSQTSLILENESGESVYVQKVRSDCSTNPGWFTLRRSGSSLKLWTECGECRCSQSDAGACEPVACPAACSPGRVEELPSGETISHEWDGSYWKQVELENGSCYRDTIPPTEAEMSAEFCWGTGEERPDQPGGEITGETCRSVSFSYGVDTEVRFTVE